MHAGDQRVGGRDQLRAGRALEESRVVADSEHDVTALHTAAAEIARDELGLRQRHVRSLMNQCSAARSVRAARSSTAFTNLWPSVAPKRLASCTASLITVRNGTSGSNSSS